MDTKNFRKKALLQKDWHWEIAIYLFLGGVGAGAYVTGAISSFLGWTDMARWGVLVSFPALAIGLLFLVAHLGNPLRTYLAASKAGTSWISRGVIFFSVFMLVAIIHIIGTLWVELSGTIVLALSVIGIIFALGTMVYTGALLSASKGIPFWRSGIMPILFMFSALATGLAATVVFVYFFGSTPFLAGIAPVVALIAAALILGEAVVVLFFLHAAYRLPESRDSAVTATKKGSFIVGDVLLGLLVPLALMLYVGFGNAGGNTGTLMVIAGILVIIGGLLLRYMVLSVGMITTMYASGFEFKLQNKPEPKSPIGLVPPGNV
ncbi:MAG: polysulfide reductase NrfD [bacterium]|nr:MAG: polysulfide reductase NrfD [bacterium]